MHSIAPDLSFIYICDGKRLCTLLCEHMVSDSNGSWVHQIYHHQHSDISDFCGDCSCQVKMYHGLHEGEMTVEKSGQEKEVTQLSPTIQCFEEGQGEAEGGG